MTLEHLKRFRQDLYELLGKGADATMDLMDAVLTTKSVQSFAELSLSPVFRRKWPSLYEAIEDVRPQRDELMKLCINKIPDIQDKRIILAGLKKYYKKEELAGKQVIVVANLEPRKMRGMESQGMLLAAVSSDESKVIVLSPEKKAENGWKVM